jgi:rhamnogalacturonan endolyase
MKLRTVLAVIALAFPAVAAAAPPPAPAGAPVTVYDHGRDVVLANGLVTVTIDPANATIISARYGNHEMVSRTGRHRTIYFSRDGGGDYETLPHCAGSAVTATDDTADYRCRHTFDSGAGDKHAWDVDIHFVMRRGVPGVYVYAVTSHPANYPELSVGEWRMVWSTPEDRNDFLDTICVDPARHWQIPSPADFAKAVPVEGAPKEVSRLTSGPWAGKLDCKYEYSANYWDLGCWGFADSSKHLGAFVVLPSHEWFNDGPNKQDLTAAVGTTLLHLNMNHYDGTGFTIPAGKEWRKCYGPWLIYFNDKPTADECWQDAQNRAATEAKAWPYDWVTSEDYPQKAGRGTVSGKLILHDVLSPKLTADNAWVGLSPPADVEGGDFQFSATGYQFWTHAGSDGSFSLANVRPGTYTLYAYTTGVVGQFEKADVVVRPGGTTALNALDWTVIHPGKQIAWQIGVPDRSAAEFGHGDDYFLPLMYQTLQTQTAEPLDFTIGKSDQKKDWFYAQTGHGTGAKLQSSHWRIHFDLKTTPAGESTLTLAFAGADRAKLGIDANGKDLGTVVPPIQGGNGLVREAVHTKYSVSTVKIPAADLHVGDNVITLTLQSPGSASYLMYDYLSLETP